MRKLIFATGEFYHIFNRGVDKRKIFLKRGHYVRFVETLKRILKTGSATPGLLKPDKSLALYGKLNFVCYCLMPNHYHFLLRQREEDGITEFMHKLSTSYTKYFNLANKRTGRLFGFTFKAVHVESDEQLLHLSRYVHLNPLIGKLTSNLKRYSWSSYPEYINAGKDGFCRKEEILGFYPGRSRYKDYQRFVLNNADYAKRLHEIASVTIDDSGN